MALTKNVYQRRANRTYRRRKYSRSHRTWRKTGANVGSLAYKAYKTANFVRSIVNTEYKYLDTNLDFSPVQDDWLIFPLTNVAQGDDNFQRQGRSILGKAIYFRLTFDLASLPSAALRLVLVRYTACNGALPDPNQMFEDPTNVSTFRSLSGPIRNYTLIWDKRFTMDADNLQTMYVDKYFKISDHIKYVGVDSSTESLGNNSYFFMVLSNQAAGSLGMYGTARFRYIDN